MREQRRGWLGAAGALAALLALSACEPGGCGGSGGEVLGDGASGSGSDGGEGGADGGEDGAEGLAVEVDHGPWPRRTAWGPEDPAQPGLNAPPEGFVDLREAVPGVRLDVRYHGPDNFTGAPLPGYGAAGAWLRAEAAEALARVQEGLAEQGLGLLIYDAYRPARASEAMVAWAARTDNGWVLEQGYVAPRSTHAHGVTVDLSLLRLDTGEAVEMGTPWDEFSDRSHVSNATGEALENRNLLQGAMAREGFRPYGKEWWHFRYPLDDTEPRDAPYGCAEAPEGTWQAPADLSSPERVAPEDPGVLPCPVALP